jgi:trimeric autotransporter adhesin
MKKILFFLITAVFFTKSNSQVFNLVKDINAGINDANPSNFTNVNGILFFTATNAANGTELWKSGGTALTTVMVKDINPGAASSSPSNFLNINGTLYFRANNGVNGIELWKSDGTAAGTMMIKDINPGAASSSPLQLSDLNGTLVFNALTPTHGRELWKSNGTAATTVLVKDIYTGIEDSHPSWFTDLNGSLYFAAVDAANGSELWKTDGTAAGTVLVKDIFPGIDPFTLDPNSSGPIGLLTVNNILFFRAFDNTEGWSLWKSDGSGAGTLVVKPGGGISMPGWLTDVNNTLFFTSSEDKLWKSDGTAIGTVMVKEIDPTAGLSQPQYLVNVNGTLFFAAQDPLNNYQLWKSNGTAAGTVMVKNVIPEQLTNCNGTLYFSGNNGINGEEIWKSDGTPAGTVMVQNIATPGDGSPASFTLIGIKIFVAVTDEVTGRELWMGRLPATHGFITLKNDGDGAGNQNKTELYPNPIIANATLLIRAEKNQTAAYHIMDQNGRTVQQRSTSFIEGINRITITASELPAGVYTIVIHIDSKTIPLKFVKQ